tara:strand:+ start:1345 stop:1650 length:306 start_codon:yes stop_codon:yes gene_type:complete
MLRKHLFIFLFLLVFALSAGAQENPVNLNQADINALCALPGIGPKKAKAIIDYRNRRPFTRPSQLVNVKGIGRKTMKRLLPLIEVAPIIHHQQRKKKPTSL